MGRDRELDAVLHAASGVPTAGQVSVLLSGEAGIGKSTLLDAAVASLADRGARVWPVHADALRRRIPYAAVAESLRAITGVDSSYAAGLLRECVAAFESTEPDGWFGRACASVTRLLTALTAAGSLVVAIDDLDQLDDDSQALLTVCLRRLANAPVAVLATLRHGPAPLLDALGTPVAVPLGPLAVSDVAALLDLPLDVAEAVHHRADGNPFFALELAGSLPGEPRLTRRDALLRRVAPLGPDTRAVAEAMSVLRRIRLDRLDLIAAVTALPRPSVDRAFDELTERRVIGPDGAHGYRFTHALVTEALYEEIGPARRRGLHAGIAAGMLADRALGLPTDLLELAWHVSESAQPGDPVAIEVLTEAAELARPRAPERAAALGARLLELLPSGPPRSAVQAIRCRALARAARSAEAIAAGHAALAGLPAGPERAKTVTALVSSLFLTGRIAEAIEVVDAEPASAALHASRALLLAVAGRTEEALAEAELTERSVTGVPPAQQVQAFCQLTMASSILLRHERTPGYADRALAAAGTSTTLRLQALAVGASTTALCGLVPDAAARLAESGSLPSDLFRGELLIAACAVHWLRGRWDDALRGLAEASAELVDAQVMLAGAGASIELAIRGWRGELDLAARLAARPAPAPRNLAGLHAVALADYHLARGEPGAAEQLITRATADPAEQPYACLLLARLVELRLAAGRRDEALAALGTLTEVAADRSTPWSRLSVLRAGGIVHRDADALRAAVDVAAAGELVFEQARTVVELAAVDGTATDELLWAYRTFAGLGVHSLRRAAGRRLRELGVTVPRARPRSAGLLTETEDRIARLVRQGMRNREIAAALHYSPRSVEVYLSRIYAKLGISSRLELARVLDNAERLSVVEPTLAPPHPRG